MCVCVCVCVCVCKTEHSPKHSSWPWTFLTELFKPFTSVNKSFQDIFVFSLFYYLCMLNMAKTLNVT